MPLSDASCFFVPFKPGISNGVVVGKKSTTLNLTDIIRTTAWFDFSMLCNSSQFRNKWNPWRGIKGKWEGNGVWRTILLYVIERKSYLGSFTQTKLQIIFFQGSSIVLVYPSARSSNSYFYHGITSRNQDLCIIVCSQYETGKRFTSIQHYAIYSCLVSLPQILKSRMAASL